MIVLGISSNVCLESMQNYACQCFYVASKKFKVPCVVVLHFMARFMDCSTFQSNIEGMENTSHEYSLNITHGCSFLLYEPALPHCPMCLVSEVTFFHLDIPLSFKAHHSHQHTLPPLSFLYFMSVAPISVHNTLSHVYLQATSSHWVATFWA